MLPSKTSPETYGPPLSDYDEVVDPETEISATKLEALCVDVSGMTYTAPRGYAKVSMGPAAVSVHRAVWGDAAGVAPTVLSSATGKHVVTWPTSTRNLNPTYDRQVSTVTDIKSANVAIHVVAASSYTPYTAAVEITSGNSVTVVTGNGTSLADVPFTVWIY